MKKTIFVSASSLFCFVVNGMQSSDTLLVKVDGGSQQLATVSVAGSGMLAVRSSGGEVTRDVREALRYNRILELVGNQARLSFVKGTESEGVFVRSDETLEKLYPCIKDFLEIVPSDASHSFAVYKLFAETEELGRIQLSAHHVDSERPLAHQTKILASAEDDASLSTKRTVQTFVDVDGSEKAIKTDDISIPYTFTERQDDRYADAQNDRRWTVRDFVRGDGSTFSRDWQDLGLILKRPAPPPVQPAATVYHQVQHGGGAPGNPFTRWFGW